MPDDLNDRLSQLNPEARARVEEALKLSLEKELAVGGASNPAAAFSRGILFSRSASAIRDIEEQVINQAAKLDDAQFDAFVNRLSKLKNR